MRTQKGRGIITLGDTRKAGGIHYEIMSRCYNPNRIIYPKYGGRGIGVCEEWHDRETFKKWLYEQGFNGTQRLERIDATKDYSPENCRLGTRYKKKEKKPKVKKAKAKREKKRQYRIKTEDNPVYSIYNSMRNRCENPNNNKYKNYGARGIKVCDEWRGENGVYNFTMWAINHGWQKGLSIDRIDNDGDYSPDNCRFTDRYAQANNKRNSIKHNYYNKQLTLGQIAYLEGVDTKELSEMVNQQKKTVGESIAQLKGREDDLFFVGMIDDSLGETAKESSTPSCD